MPLTCHQKVGNYICLLLCPLSIYYYYSTDSQESKYKPRRNKPQTVLNRLVQFNVIRRYVETNLFPYYSWVKYARSAPWYQSINSAALVISERELSRTD